MQIYLARNNQQAGPYSLEELNQMLATQQVLLTDLVWHQGMQEWKALGELTQGQLYYQPNQEPPFNPNATSTNAYQNPSIQKISVEKKTNQTELASLGSRFLAKIIDLAFWLPISFILTAFFTPEQQQTLLSLNEQFTQAILSQPANIELAEQIQSQTIQMIPTQAILAAIIYIIVMLAVQAFLIAKSGQSIGKKVTKIKIVDAESGQQVNLLRGFTIRSIVFIFFGIILAPFFSLIDVLFGLGSKRQTLHDRVAKTKVVKR